MKIGNFLKRIRIVVVIPAILSKCVIIRAIAFLPMSASFYSMMQEG